MATILDVFNYYFTTSCRLSQIVACTCFTILNDLILNFWHFDELQPFFSARLISNFDSTISVTFHAIEKSSDYES